MSNEEKIPVVLEKETATKLALFDDFRKDVSIVSKEAIRVPTSYVFGRGSLAHAESFGDKTFAENAAQVDKAIEEVGKLENIWNHSHSQWTWRHLNLNYHAPLNNMRQICAEIAKLKGALNDAKWRNVEVELKIKKIQEELNKEDLDYWKEVELKIKLAKLREGLSEGMVYIEGAMKDVLALNKLYEELREKVNGFSEVDVEREETKSHLRRSIVQCIRDVRQYGCITKGEQEYVENIGVNPSKLELLLRQYVEEERKIDSWDVTPLFQFVEQLANDLTDVCKVDNRLMEVQGFSGKFVEDFAYGQKLALKQEKEETPPGE